MIHGKEKKCRWGVALVVSRVPVVYFELHGAVVHHGVGGLNVGLQVQLQLVERRERQSRDDVLVQLLHNALDNRLIYAIEGAFDFFLGLGTVM